MINAYVPRPLDRLLPGERVTNLAGRQRNFICRAIAPRRNSREQPNPKERS